MKNLIFAILLFLFAQASAQYEEPKFGKIEMADLSLIQYDKDTSAEALMLFDIGGTKFNLNYERKFQYVFTRHCRIKIFKKSAFNLADVSIKLYEKGANKEKIGALKAVTYNLENGKISKTKLDNDKIYTTEGKDYTERRFAFPEVREGSIIELSYSITSDFMYNLRGWNFQYSFPVVWSKYEVSIPEYYDYRQSSKGYLNFDVYKSEPTTESFTYHVDAELESSAMVGGGKPAENHELKANCTRTTFAISHVPAFISEPNIDNEDNYFQSVEFELKSIQYPNDIRHDFTQSWEAINKNLNEDEDFGELLKSSGFVKDIVTNLCENKQSELDKAVQIYSYVQANMKWNGIHQKYAIKGLKKPFNDHVGSSSEINLLLTLMLKTAGLKANPVIFSTRDNGIATTFYPTSSKFNSVMSSVEIEGKLYLLDATQKYIPFGVIPANDVNGQGRIINNLSGDWANLQTSERFMLVRLSTLNINQDGKLNGLIMGNYGGYAGIAYRNRLGAEKNSDDYIRKMQENVKGLTINKFSMTDLANIYKPVADSLTVEISDNIDQIGDKIMFYPMIYDRLDKNHYTLEERKYPVDYNYPISETYIYDYTLPPGYEVESIPKSASIKLPDNSISIMYNIQVSDNKIKVVFKRSINKIMFLPEEYKALKELYDQIVKKQAEQIILKKIV